jgi:hypothetical protein
MQQSSILKKYEVMSRFARYVGGWAECRIEENAERAALTLSNLNRSSHLDPGAAALVLGNRMSIARLGRVKSQLCGRCQGKYPFPWWTLPMRLSGGVGGRRAGGTLFHTEISFLSSFYASKIRQSLLEVLID